MFQPHFVVPVVSNWELIASFSGAAATFLSVLTVIGVYYWQLKKEKKDSALVLLMEIRNAERAISDIKNTKTISETTSVMPVSSWQRFQHLFVADFDLDELSLINDFYNLCIDNAKGD